MSATPPTSSPPPPSTATSPPPNSSSPPPQAPSPPAPASPPSNPSPPPASPPTSPPTSPPSDPPPAPVSPPVSPPKPPPPAPVSPPQAPPPAPVSPPPASPPPQSPPPTAPPPESPPPPATPPPPNSTPPPPSSPAPPPSNRSPPPPLLSPPPPDTPFLSPPPPDTPLLSPPPPSLSPPPPPPLSSSSSTGLIAGIAAGTVIGVALLLGFVFFLYNRRRTRRRDVYDPFYPSPSPSGNPYRPGQLQTSLIYSQPPPPSSPSFSTESGRESGPKPNVSPKPPSPAPPPAVAGGSFKYEDLELATNGFAESNVLGQGGFGLVYRGTLSGKEVAIKKLKSGGGQGDREFRAEVEIISRVHHRNLVSLVGYCVHEDQRLLVYEYVPNKTLDFHLHGSGRPTLDWPRRWKIALGAAKGLAYLHEDCDPKIIHRDIKAANILLDYNFEPKVADFGLAKFVPTDMTHVSTRVMGTFGYVAPEYVTSGKLTDRSDVYSYGVMLLELITGRKPIMASDPQMDQSLVNWARPLLSRATNGDIPDELVDPWLETNYDQYDMTRLIHCAAAAVRELARKRPRMGQIERYLEGEISLEDLNAGMMPGDSNVKANSTEQEVLRRMAFGGILSEELAESDQTSDYEMASSTGANTEDIEQQRLNKMAQSSEV